MTVAKRRAPVRPRKPGDQTVVIFGASGDLVSRKLIGALWALDRDGLMPDEWRVVGYARTDLDDERFRERMREALTKRPDFAAKRWTRFAKRLHYVRGAYDDLAGLDDELREHGVAGGRRLYYCSVPPSAYEPIVAEIGRHRLGEGSRMVVEKPFGHDLASAKRLNRLIHQVFDEDQVFRIDHYLGKETVQNILVFRFSNGMFEPIWNRRYVTQVEITVAESEGVGHRGGFYEEAGALRDIVQNHIFQVLTFLTMEPPASFDPGALRDEKSKVLAALRRIEPEDTVFGQYGPGRVDGRKAPGYRSEEGVDPRSRTETFVAMRLWIDNWRWATVPFYVRTGKRLPRRVTEVTMKFHDAPHSLFRDSSVAPNHLTLRIQPDEGICLSFDAKVPGPEMRIEPVTMDFSYGAHFGSETPEAYERLLRDAMVGDHTLFPRSDEVERAWDALETVVHDRPRLYRYAAGTWGPRAAHDLVPGGWHLGD
ncbi:MAG TPA: glucose-6-phosphate dehydrogenase [Actinomycetota bacterium]|nr:glucose-6-phosphate dehydrogenase [Actinomycetota bacterium]